MKKALLIILILLLSISSFTKESDPASPIDGYWEGVLTFQGFNLPFMIEFATIDNSIVGLMDIPQQKAYGLLLENIRFNNDSLYFEYNAPIGLASYTGVYDQYDNNIIGEFNQGNVDGEFKLVKPKSIEVKFHEIDVELELSDVILSGTLTLPDTVDKYPAVLMITGSGAQNRDEQIGLYKPFKEIASALAKAGYASLRFDDPGIGFSEIKGDTMEYSMNVSTEDFAEHAWKEFKFLQKQNYIDKSKCGLLGHSEGGMIAAMLSAKSDDPAFAIFMAAPAVPGSTLVIDQLRNFSKQMGFTTEHIDSTIKFQRKISRMVTEGDLSDDLEDMFKKDIIDNIAMLPVEMLDDLDTASYVEQQLQMKMLQVSMKWTKFYMSYNPYDALREMKCPVLAIFGEKDMQVSVDVNLLPMTNALEEAPTKDFEIITLENANHLFQPLVDRGGPEPSVREELISGFDIMIINWLDKRFSK